MTAVLRTYLWVMFFIATFLLFVFCTGCGTGASPHEEEEYEGPAGLSDGRSEPVDIVYDDEDSFEFYGVVWEHHQVPAPAPPANPQTGQQTPDEYNYVNYFRYRADTGDEPPKEVSAILMLLPGFTVGGNYLQYTANNLVEMTEGDIEVWIIERRFHNLEDTHGMIVAEAAKDPGIAMDYYFKGAQVEGKTFEGFLSAYNEDTDFLSEWGLDVMMNDIRAVIEVVPEDKRRQTLFLGGHSRGAAHIKAYGAYVFEDGKLGCEDLAGLVMIDGESRYMPIYTENMYETSLTALRKGNLPRYMTLPPLGPPVYTFIEIMAMAASEDFADPSDPRLGPEGIFGDYGPWNLLIPFLVRFKDITLTNEAFFGMMFDSESGPINLLHGGVGKFDGPTKDGIFGVYPSDENHVYRWIHYDQTEPQEYCEIQDMIRTFYYGPSNSTDPYYSTRLDFDFWVAHTQETEGTWRGKYFDFQTSKMDAPVYLIGTKLLSQLERHLLYMSMLPPARGQDLPRDQYGFDILFIPEWEHLDSAYAALEINPFFPDLIDWLKEFSQGTVQLD